jgi:chromosomal replication initiator protein
MSVGVGMAVDTPHGAVCGQNWSSICSTLRTEFGDNVYDNWMSSIKLVFLNSCELVMSVPTGFIRDWILREYFEGRYRMVDGTRTCIKKGLKQVFLDYFPNLVSFSIIVDRSQKTVRSDLMETTDNTEKSSNGVEIVEKNLKTSEQGNSQSIGVELNKNFTFDRYVVGTPNRLAFEVAKNFVNDQEFGVGANPLFIYGGVGLGKTHLCQAMAWEIVEKNPERRVVYLSAERFMYLFVQALRNQDIGDFKDKFRSADILIVDDVQFITGKDKTQKEFFYTVDTLLGCRKRIVMACDRAPANLDSLDEKLRSRMSGGLIVDIKEFDYQFRLDIIRKKSTELGLILDEPLMELLAEKLNRTCREIEGCLRKLFINQSIMKTRVQKNDIESVLVENLGYSCGSVTIDSIQVAVAEHFGVPLAGLKSKSRHRNLVIPRHVAMYLSKKLTSKSFAEIAGGFNGKNHTTVMHAINKVKELMENDPKFFESVRKLTNYFDNISSDI